jgi:hypothetical protein
MGENGTSWNCFYLEEDKLTIPANVFIRHYWTPSFQELGDRALKAAELLG